MALTSYAANAFVDHFLRAVPVTSPATIYLALHTADADPEVLGDEVTGGSYSRQAVTFGAPDVNGVTRNTTAVVFTDLPAVEVTHAAVWTDDTAGDVIFWFELDDPKTVADGEGVSWPIASIYFDLEA